MSKVNRIRIFCVLFAVFMILIGNIYIYRSNLWVNDLEELVQETETEIVTEQEKTTSVQNVTEYQYVIVEENDYLVVYYADRQTVYEYTDIQYSSLDDTIRQKIRKGYWISDEAVLFGFLENYST